MGFLNTKAGLVQIFRPNRWPTGTSITIGDGQVFSPTVDITYSFDGGVTNVPLKAGNTRAFPENNTGTMTVSPSAMIEIMDK